MNFHSQPRMTCAELMGDFPKVTLSWSLKNTDMVTIDQELVIMQGLGWCLSEVTVTVYEFMAVEQFDLRKVIINVEG